MKKHLVTTGRITRKIIHIKLMLVILMIMPLAVFTLLTSKSSFIGDIRSMVVLSGSMAPAIQTGGVVYVRPDTLYGVGDIISFTSESGMTVTHRVVEIVNGDEGIAYRTKGDANNNADTELVAQKSVIGKSIFSVPYLGYAINWLKTPKGFMLAIIVPTLIFIGMELWAIKGEIEKSVEKKVLERLQTV